MSSKPQTALDTNLTTACPEVEIVQSNDPVKHAASLKDKELLAHLSKSYITIKDSLPYLREARERFAAPGRRLPVAGSPTWSKWVEMNLHVTIRTVQRWLEPPKEDRLKKKATQKPENVRFVQPLRDWPAAQRRANDLVLALKRLAAQGPIGSDMLVEPVQELATIIGYTLAKKEGR